MKVTKTDVQNIKNIRELLRGVIKSESVADYYLSIIEHKMEASLEQGEWRKETSVPKCEIKFSKNNWTTGDFIFNGKSYGFALEVGAYKMFIYRLMRFNNNYMTKRESESVRKAFRAAKKSNEDMVLMEELANKYFLFLHHHMYAGAEQVIALYESTGFTFLDAGNFTDKTKDTFINVDISSFNFENKCSCLDNSLGSHIYSVAFVDKFIEFANGVRIGFR